MEQNGNLPSSSEEICKSYAGYLDIQSMNVLSNIEEEIDGILKSMDELYTTLLSMQEINEEVVTHRVSGFMEKAQKLESIFDQIDAMYLAISAISSNLGQLEAAANSIDKHLFSSNPLKKMFGFFKSSSDSEPSKVHVPAVFSADDIFHLPHAQRSPET